MVVKALKQGNYQVSEVTNFSDVDSGFWGYDNIQRAVFLDVMKGLPDGTFLPQGQVSKAQAIAIVVSSLKLMI
ncbi:MAG: S-layer homology domain-containing protein [Candidatus Melainabacteria bacterium]|nr:MAG: S-layer homology domain-containing protein [Candidatus Melainabacteria bacterium]